MTEVLRVAAFADPHAPANHHVGNPAGIVLDATGLSPQRLLAIAADLGYSETVFVVRESGTQKQVRYFSPSAEIPFCGNATIALAIALAQLVGPGSRGFLTPAGAIAVTTALDGTGALSASLVSVTPRVSALEATVLQ